jgi:protein-arginine kinase activator protein McsA
MDIVRIINISDNWCEYCSNKPIKVYLPFAKNVVNPARICEKCAEQHTVIDWYETENDYLKELRKLKLT